MDTGAEPSQSSHGSSVAGRWKATLRSSVGAVNAGRCQACGRTAAGQLGRSTRISDRVASTHGSAKVASCGTGATAARRRGADRPAAWSSAWTGRLSMLCQNGIDGAEPSRRPSASRDGSSSGPGTSGGTDSSCSRPSTPATAHTIAFRMGLPSWVIETVEEPAVRPGLALRTSMSIGSGRATPR